MKANLEPGLTRTQTVVVDAPRVTHHMGEHLGVYATPAMMSDIEILCRNFLREFVGPGQESVGTRVDIQHLAATPEGMSVEITAKVVAVDRRAVTFEAVVRDALDVVGRCTHHRFIVDLDRLKERLTAKIAKATAR